MFPACGEGKLEDTPPEPEGLMLVVGAPTMCPDQVPWKIFCTTVLLFQNASLADFQRVNGAMGAILKKMAVFLKENALRVNHFSDFNVSVPKDEVLVKRVLH